MNKTVTITINGIVFTIEEDAFKVLEAYINSISAQFGSYDDKEDIVEDIEARIAEIFEERLKKSGTVITSEDVDFVTEKMGAAEEFVEDDGEEVVAKVEEKPVAQKRLYRDADNQVIAGVCAGLAEYFGIDPVIVRVTFVVLAITGIFSGVPIILYLILWISVPEAKTVSEKMEMKGDPVTLKNIEETIRESVKKNDIPRTVEEKVSTVGNTVGSTVESVLHKVGRALKRIGEGSGKIVKVFVIALLIIVGASLIIAGFAGIFGTSVAFGVVAFNPGSPLIDAPLHILGEGTVYYSLLGFGALVVLIPLILILLVGMCMTMRRNFFNGAVTTVLVFSWIIAVTVTSALLFRVAPEIEQLANEGYFSEEYEYEERVYALSDFAGVDVSGAIDYDIQYGEEYSVHLSGSETDLDRAEVEVVDGVLNVGRGSHRGVCIFCFGRPLTINVVMPELSTFQSSGASDGVLEGFAQEEMEVSLSGASDMVLKSDVETLSFSASGASDAELEGGGATLTIDLSGASDIDAREFAVVDVEVHASGASSVLLGAVESLSVDLSGASDVFYSGEPEVTEEVSGGSGLIQLEAEEDEE